MPRAEPPLIVAGMHRSGTSLVAAHLADLGVDMGRDSRAPDRHNPHGYREDGEVKALHRRALAAATRVDDGGHRDWGWTESEELDESRFAEVGKEARRLLAARTGPRPKGFKDPRATLFLDFWAGLAPDARFLLLYRPPWAVADSMTRLGAEVFVSNPEYAYRIWRFYNRRLLDFRRRHRGRSLLVATDALLDRPRELGRLLRERLAIPVDRGSLLDRLDPELYRRVPADDPLPGLTLTAWPECAELLAALEAEADLPSGEAWRPGGPRRPAGADEPRLAVVVPCRDLGALLVEAVASVERAPLPGIELVIVDDGSKDPTTVAIVDRLAAVGYRVIRQANRGVAAARNRAIAATRAPLILPLDADNRIAPGFPARAARVLEARPEVGVVYGDREEFGLRCGRVEVPEFDLDQLLWANYIDTCAVFRRRLWEETSGYDTQLVAWADWELWLHAAACGWRFHRLPEVTFEYRVRPQSLNARTRNLEVRRGLRRQMLDKHRDLYLERLPAILEEKFRVLHAQRAAIHRLEAEREELAARAGDLEQGLVASEVERGRIEELRRAERAEMESDLAELEEELGHLAGIFAEIRASNGWRFLQRFWRRRDALLPPGSRRRRLYDALLSRVRGER